MKSIVQVLCVIYTLMAIFLGVPLCVALFLGESIRPFLLPMLILIPIFIICFLMLRTKRKGIQQSKSMNIRTSFVVVVIGWLGSALVGMIPFLISGAIPSFSDAFFESMSGLTTTGASILTDIETLPYSILFWRSSTHWLGGMGIVVLTVAVLPMLGVDRLKLMMGETPGPTVERTTHTIGRSAKILWISYLGLTVLEVIFLRIAGLDFLEALTHTFGTLATGGFSTKNASIGYYTSPFVRSIITIFMVLAGVNFAVYTRLLRGNIQGILKDIELRVYLLIFLISSAIIAGALIFSGGDSIGGGIMDATFQSASILTTTGYATTDYSTWPMIAQAVLFLLMLVGGCAGSTGGGVKVIRLLVMARQARYSMRKMIYPRAITSFQIGQNTIDDETVQSVSGFLFLYAVFALITVLAIAADGADLLTAISGSLAVIGNIGPGFAGVGPAANYSAFSPILKLYLALVMLLGRLELYTIILLFVRKNT